MFCWGLVLFRKGVSFIFSWIIILWEINVHLPKFEFSTKVINLCNYFSAISEAAAAALRMIDRRKAICEIFRENTRHLLLPQKNKITEESNFKCKNLVWISETVSRSNYTTVQYSVRVVQRYSTDCSPHTDTKLVSTVHRYGTGTNIWISDMT